MKPRLFDHIDLRVKDMERAKNFYVPLLNAIGFTVDQGGKAWVSYEAPGAEGKPTEFFGFTHDPNHRPNGTRIAFWADSREEVNRVAEVARTAGAQNIEGPELCVEYDPNYYAVFFEDPEGNKLEVCCRKPAQ
jgi:catechol 2,3-dioxygenase-like lactoylglutathione lyase family enzyme